MFDTYGGILYICFDEYESLISTEYFYLRFQMINTLEKLPNEILLSIFSYLTWDEILVSLSKINRRFDCIIRTLFSSRVIKFTFDYLNCSYAAFSSTLIPLLFDSSMSFYTMIESVHFDEWKSVSFDFCHQLLFLDCNEQAIFFPNLESLSIYRCLISIPLLQTLSSLIQYQLNHLTLKFDHDAVRVLNNVRGKSPIIDDIGKMKISKSIRGCNSYYKVSSIEIYTIKYCH